MNDMFNRPTTTRPEVPVPADVQSATELPPGARPPADTTATDSAARAAATPVAPAPPAPQHKQEAIESKASADPRPAQVAGPQGVKPAETHMCDNGTDLSPTNPTAQSPTASTRAPGIHVGMTKDQLRRYAEDTKQRGSRARPSPSIAKYRKELQDLVELKAVIKVVFKDLIGSDRQVLDEFGEDGYRAFNARLSRELK